jgi:hypothetical protein
MLGPELVSLGSWFWSLLPISWNHGHPNGFFSIFLLPRITTHNAKQCYAVEYVDLSTLVRAHFS